MNYRWTKGQKGFPTSPKQTPYLSMSYLYFSNRLIRKQHVLKVLTSDYYLTTMYSFFVFV